MNVSPHGANPAHDAVAQSQLGELCDADWWRKYGCTYVLYDGTPVYIKNMRMDDHEYYYILLLITEDGNGIEVPFDQEKFNPDVPEMGMINVPSRKYCAYTNLLIKRQWHRAVSSDRLLTEDFDVGMMSTSPVMYALFNNQHHSVHEALRMITQEGWHSVGLNKHWMLLCSIKYKHIMLVYKTYVVGRYDEDTTSFRLYTYASGLLDRAEFVVSPFPLTMEDYLCDYICKSSNKQSSSANVPPL